MRPTFAVLLVIATALLGIAIGVMLTRLLMIVHEDFVAPDRLFSAQEPLALPSLQVIARNAERDEDALTAIVDYFDANHDALETEFEETNPDRLKALYVMYLVHTSHIYAALDQPPVSFLDFLHRGESHCGTTSWAQSLILDSMGVPWRIISISGGTHTFVEARIGGQWEFFDATINVWASRSAFEMERGVERSIRSFYTPLLDPSYRGLVQPDALRAGQELRVMMPLLGIGFYPKAVLFVEGEATWLSSDISMNQND